MPLSYGVEIECVVPTPRDGNYREIGMQRGPIVAAAIEAQDVPCTYVGYSHTVDRARWKIVTDASLRTTMGYTGLEIVSPPLMEGEESFAQVTRVCNALRGLGAGVNRSCGLHVHVEVRHLSVAALRRLAIIYADHEDVIDGLLPPSRRGTANSYSQPVKGFDLSQVSMAGDAQAIARAIRGGQRYVKLNFTSYWKYGTVEFRHHSGTIDAAKIIKWVTLCCSMVRAAERTANEPIQAFPTATFQRRRDREVFTALTRPEGITSEELRLQQGARSRISFPGWLTQHNLTARTLGRRGGRQVWQIIQAVQQQTVATLESMVDFLRLSDEDRAFWTARRNALANGSTSMHATSLTSMEALP